ncbi:MAG: thioredoxin domain-containing protein, partial [Deltaproteobacteria bacterium]|nr:thioredoxin domain-containing protein [Deltaproteobacteria bacterium]
MESSLPGVSVFDPELVLRFEQVRKARGEGYRPRTKHLRPDGWAKYTNRLFLETSPYLLQHAHNPVNWYPWGDEAFEQGRKLKRPVLVSIGYSTCHWCHVMEEESFENEEIARFLNENFIAIKVDREERPDVDAIYMKAVQALTGAGGWPLNVWLTPDRKPFYGGTYFPPGDGSGRGIGFLSLLKGLKTAYDSRPEEVAEVSLQLTKHIRETLSPEGGKVLPESDSLALAAQFYESRFDSVNGGMAGSPKFPSSLPIRFLLRYHRRTGEQKYLDMAALTLRKMAYGGMYDQAGGGFHRYSTDDRWLVPHFEKMLYDSALLVAAYLEAYQATGEKEFARIVRETLHFIEREMTAPEGAFYSATDADSLAPNGEREEGTFFTWTPKELEDLLGSERSRIVGRYYGVSEKGNFEGRSILHVPESPSAVAASLSLSEEKLHATLSEAKENLYRERNTRPRPLRDEKILTAWNGLAISAYARAGLVLDDSRYVEKAGKAARFLLANLYHDGRLYRTHMEGKRKTKGFLEDYAFLIAGLLDLYEASGDLQWLEKAIELDAILENRFEDKTQGGYFMTGDDHENLLVREKPSYDGAEPSGNSVEVLNLLRLHEFTSRDGYRRRAEASFRSLAETLRSSPVALAEMLLAVDFYLDAPKQILIVAPPGKKGEAAPLLSVFRSRFVPNRILSVVSERGEQEKSARIIPLLDGKEALEGQATAYVCENRVCKLPTRDPAEFGKQLRTVKT